MTSRQGRQCRNIDTSIPQNNETTHTATKVRRVAVPAVGTAWVLVSVMVGNPGECPSGRSLAHKGSDAPQGRLPIDLPVVTGDRWPSTVTSLSAAMNGSLIEQLPELQAAYTANSAQRRRAEAAHPVFRGKETRRRPTPS